MLKVRNNILGLYDTAVNNTLKSIGTIADQYKQEALEYEWILINRYRYTENDMKCRADEINNAVKGELQLAYNKAVRNGIADFNEKPQTVLQLEKIAESNGWKLKKTFQHNTSTHLDYESYSDADSGL